MLLYSKTERVDALSSNSIYNNHFMNSKIFPKKFIKIAAMRCALETQSSIRFLSALLFLRGVKLLSCQEGGGMAVRRINQKDIELNYIGCDYFMSWGWKSNLNNFYKSSVTKTFWRQKHTFNPKGHILLVGGSCRRYHWSLYEGQLIWFYKKYSV